MDNWCWIRKLNLKFPSKKKKKRFGVQSLFISIIRLFNMNLFLRGRNDFGMPINENFKLSKTRKIYENLLK